MPDLSRGYCVIDTETSGLNPYSDRVIELAVLTHVDGKSTVRTALLKTVEEVPAEITRITGITTQMLQEEGQDPLTVLRSFLQIPGIQDLPIVGHNLIGFDRPFLLQEIAHLIDDEAELQCARHIFAEKRLVDTGALYKGIQMDAPPLPEETHFSWSQRVLDIRVPGLYWNLRSAAHHMGVGFPEENLHRARGDALICQRLLEKILEREKRMVTPSSGNGLVQLYQRGCPESS